MTPRASTALEFPALLEILKRYVASPLGLTQLESATAHGLLRSSLAAATSLAEVSEAMEWIRASGSPDQRNLTPLPSFFGLQDCQPFDERMKTVGAILDGLEIASVLQLLVRGEETKQRLWREKTRRPLLSEYAERIADFSALNRELAGKILPDGTLADHASSDLARIRRQTGQQRMRIQTSLDKFVRRNFDAGLLQDSYATIRDGRSVVPVKASWQDRVDGVIHSVSGTGQTVFIEPLETINENNRLVGLIEEEQQEVVRILREMTQALRERWDEIQSAMSALAELEWIFARGQFAKDFRCCVPQFSDSAAPRVKLRWARHPVLEDVLKRQGGRTVPLDLELSEGRRTLVISGPNAGGKTVALKTVGLLALMAQFAIPVPADEAEFPWFTRIVADIGDLQSIEASLSTFSAHIENLKRTMSEATSGSLVIVDEIGAATDPQEGGAFAVAVVEHLLDAGAFTLASTHLPRLKVWAANHDGVVSAAMGFDRSTLAPTHRLIIGVPGQSAGLAMAQRLGVPAAIIERAHRALADEEQETAKFLERLHGIVSEAEERERQVEVAERRLKERERVVKLAAAAMEQRIKGDMEERFRSALRRAESSNREALDKALQQMKARAATKRGVAQSETSVAGVRRRTQESFSVALNETLGVKPADTAAPDLFEVEAGMEVHLASFGSSGRVLRQVGDGAWEVQIGQLKVRADAKDMSEVAESENPVTRLPSGVTFSSEIKSRASLTEINVIGQSVDEAHDAVDKFLDEAVLAEVERLRVIHGFGTNTLRRALWSMFAKHVHVSKFYQAEQQEGGGGATIVEVRV
jgi:DNA mismatch repair protein MutS2